MKKVTKHFSLGEAYKNKVPVVGLVVKDAEAEETGKMIAMLSISMMYDGRLVEANIPLDNIPDFKRHILAIITEASKLKAKKDTVKKELVVEK
jgi:hypothetical protein